MALQDEAKAYPASYAASVLLILSRVDCEMSGLARERSSMRSGPGTPRCSASAPATLLAYTALISFVGTLNIINGLLIYI